MRLFSIQSVRWALCGSLLLLFLLVSSRPALAQTIRYVKPTATGTGDGSSWANASSNLQAMITASASGNQVWVAGGVYTPVADRTASFAMKNDVAIYGGFAGSETALTQRVLTSPSTTTLSGNIGDPATTTDNSYHVISNSGGLTTTAVLDGFLITGGRANGEYPDFYGGGCGTLAAAPCFVTAHFRPTVQPLARTTSIRTLAGPSTTRAPVARC